MSEQPRWIIEWKVKGGQTFWLEKRWGPGGAGISWVADRDRALEFYSPFNAERFIPDGWRDCRVVQIAGLTLQ